MDPSFDNHPIFDNHLLLDTILDYVVQEEGKVATSQVKQCRLVNKAWLRSINRVLQKSKNPLFLFHLFQEPQANGTNLLRRGTQLVPFMETVTEKLHLDDRVPLYSIKSSGWGAQPDACRLVLDSLTNCGNGLIALDLELSETQDPFSPNNNFSLPKLNRFTVKLHRKYERGGRDINDMQDKIDFMQSVFDATQQLKSFTLARFGITDNIVPASFGNLLLPSSIIHLELRSSLRDCHLQTLINSSLPHLTTLKLCISKSAVEGRLISSILKKVGQTLQNLLLYFQATASQTDDIKSYQLPLMGKLKTLNIANMYPSFQLGKQVSSLQHVVPVLTQINLYGQKTLRKWTEHLYLPSVTILNVSMVCDEAVELQFNRDVNISLANMQALHMALPSLAELNIMQVGTNVTALVFIMKEMRNLRCLRIGYKNSRGFLGSDIWDAVLTGLPQESIKALRAKPELWEGVQVECDVSIRNLTGTGANQHIMELNTLELYSAERNFDGISEIAFHHAFLKMPKLTNLILKGGFRTTRKMVRIWRAEGRSIQTDNPYKRTIHTGRLTKRLRCTHRN